MPPFQPANPNVVYTQPQQQYQNQNGGFPLQQFPSPGFHQPQPSQNLRELIEMVDRAVVKARRDLLAAGESVTAWKVSQSALLMLQIDNWGSLGFQMQQVPSLRSLIHIEAKVNVTASQLYFRFFFIVFPFPWLVSGKVCGKHLVMEVKRVLNSGGI